MKVWFVVSLVMEQCFLCKANVSHGTNKMKQKKIDWTLLKTAHEVLDELKFLIETKHLHMSQLQTICVEKLPEFLKKLKNTTVDMLHGWVEVYILTSITPLQQYSDCTNYMYQHFHYSVMNIMIYHQSLHIPTVTKMITVINDIIE